MKKLLIAVCVLASFAAHAQRGEKACRVYEFAELNTFADAELTNLRNKYDTIYKRIGSEPPITPAEIRQDIDDRKNCSDEMQRITRLLDSRTRNSKKK